MAVKTKHAKMQKESAIFGRITVHMGFLPAIDRSTPGTEQKEAIEKLYDHENQRLDLRVQRLSGINALAGLFEFNALNADDLRMATLVAEDERKQKAPLSSSHLKSALESHSMLGPFIKDGPDNEFALLVTNGKLVNNHLAIITGRAALISHMALSALTSRLYSDPWPALVLLFCTEIQEGLHQAKGDLSEFQSQWSVEAAYEWIKTDQGKNTIAAYHELFGDEGVNQLLALLKDLPLPGGLDKSNVKATSFSDPEAEQDWLGFDTYVQGFKRTILHKDTTTPLSIAIIGEWGKGKSSFMKFLRKELESHRLYEEPGSVKYLNDKESLLAPRAVTVWFDAWQYDSEEKVLAALLQTVAQEIQSHFTPYSWLKYRLIMSVKQTLNNWRIFYNVFLHAIIVPVALVLASVIVFAVGPLLAANQWNLATALSALFNNPALATTSAGLGGLFGLLYVGWQLLRRIPLPLGLDLNKLYEESDHSERLGFLSVFKQEFQRRIEQIRFMPTWSLKELNFISERDSNQEKKGILEPLRLSIKDVGQDFLAMFRRRQNKNQENNEKPPGNRVVVFIDDLDRCRPDKIVDILEAIKVSLDTPGIVFILGMDDCYVKTGIFLRYKDHIKTQQMLYQSVSHDGKSDKESEENSILKDLQPDGWPSRYLEKVVQISFRLPDAQTSDLRNMVAELLALKEEKKQTAVPTTPADKRKITNAEKEKKKEKKRKYHDQILAEVDTNEVNELILKAAESISFIHQGNPRRVKSFVNRCRLGLYLLKMHVPDMIQADYAEAIERFTLWEQAKEDGRSESSSWIDEHDLWHSQLREIQQCLFMLPVKNGIDKKSS